MGELPAAVGLWQLERLEAFLARRHALQRMYEAELGCLPGIRLAPSSEGSIAYRCLMWVPCAETVLRGLQERGIDARRPVYRPLHHYLGGEYPHAQAAHEQIVSLPLYPTLTDGEAERVIQAVRAMGLQ
jgi:dTDP-4-amino-4,6-dideoxygalactose transaminase